MFDRKILKYLKKWKNRKNRKPLVLRGARQVGKTSAVLMFGEQFFDDIVNINLERMDHKNWFSSDLSLKEFIQIVKIKFGKEIIQGKTLLFIDEIQNSPSLISLMRFFYEDMPELHVIVAGSLLEAKIETEGISFPVGRVEFAHMYPLDFFEFLEATEDKNSLEFLKKFGFNEKLSEVLHDDFLKKFYEYTMIGGMPEVVAAYIKGKNINDLKIVYNSLFSSYCEDVFKYANLANAKYLSFVIDNAPLFAGTLIKYEKFAGSVFRSREINKAFMTLEKVMILTQAQATSSINLPLVQQSKRPKKILFLDVGLVNYRMDILNEFYDMKDLNSFYRGRIAEQVVGQGLISLKDDEKLNLVYWAKNKSQGSAELDWCFSYQGKIIGIEVKSGAEGKMRSMIQFAKSVEKRVLVRFYSGKLRRDELVSNGEKYRLLSIPFYLLPRLFDLIT
ncbi:MAG: AAA family ATPase [Candidatus Omnitrophica bacterium]|nr:AAA family ATPase [Candidatus Omnitrophota bacterium]